MHFFYFTQLFGWRPSFRSYTIFFWKILEFLGFSICSSFCRHLCQNCGWAGSEVYVRLHINEHACYIYYFQLKVWHCLLSSRKAMLFNELLRLQDWSITNIFDILNLPGCLLNKCRMLTCMRIYRDYFELLMMIISVATLGNFFKTIFAILFILRFLRVTGTISPASFFLMQRKKWAGFSRCTVIVQPQNFEARIVCKFFSYYKM